MADLDEHLDDGALHRYGHRSRPGSGDRAASPSGAARPRPGGCPTAAGRSDLGLGDPHLDVEALAADLDEDVALHLLLSIVGVRGCPRSATDAGEVEHLLDPLGRVLDGGKVGVRQDGQIGGDRGGHAGDRGLLERTDHAGDRTVAVTTPHAQLAGEVVVELADLVAGFISAVPADADAGGHVELGERARAGQEGALGRVLGIDAAFDGVTGDRHVVLGEGKFFACGHPQLQLDQVDAGDQLGHRVLHLEAGVHLQVEELTVLVEELDRTGIDVIAARGHGYGGLAHRGDDLGVDPGGRGLLDQLLVAALRRAVPGAQVHVVAVGVRDGLHLDVARLGEVALHVGLVAAEVGQGLALSRLERSRRLIGRLDHLHAAPATAVRRLDGDRVAELLAECGDVVGAGDQLGGAGDAVDALLLGGVAGRDLVAHHLDRLGRRADEGHARLGDAAGEVGVLGEEAVAGMHRLGARLLDHLDQFVRVDVALGRGLPTEGIGLVGQAHMQCVPVQLGVDGD